MSFALSTSAAAAMHRRYTGSAVRHHSQVGAIYETDLWNVRRKWSHKIFRPTDSSPEAQTYWIVAWLTTILILSHPLRSCGRWRSWKVLAFFHASTILNIGEKSVRPDLFIIRGKLENYGGICIRQQRCGGGPVRGEPKPCYSIDDPMGGWTAYWAAAT